MAVLPGEDWLIQQIGGNVVLFHRHTEEEIVKYNVHDMKATAQAQKDIFDSDKIDDEQKSFAHFWAGYFYAHANK